MTDQNIHLVFAATKYPTHRYIKHLKKHRALRGARVVESHDPNVLENTIKNHKKYDKGDLIVILTNRGLRFEFCDQSKALVETLFNDGCSIHVWIKWNGSQILYSEIIGEKISNIEIDGPIQSKERLSVADSIFDFVTKLRLGKEEQLKKIEAAEKEDTLDRVDAYIQKGKASTEIKTPKAYFVSKESLTFKQRDDIEQAVLNIQTIGGAQSFKQLESPVKNEFSTLVGILPNSLYALFSRTNKDVKPMELIGNFVGKEEFTKLFDVNKVTGNITFNGNVTITWNRDDRPTPEEYNDLVRITKMWNAALVDSLWRYGGKVLTQEAREGLESLHELLDKTQWPNVSPEVSCFQSLLAGLAHPDTSAAGGHFDELLAAAGKNAAQLLVMANKPAARSMQEKIQARANRPRLFFSGARVCVVVEEGRCVVRDLPMNVAVLKTLSVILDDTIAKVSYKASEELQRLFELEDNTRFSTRFKGVRVVQ